MHTQLTTTEHTYIPKTGILLVNLGSPEQPTSRYVAKYLREFLWDRRVVEVPRILWWCILNLAIAPLRSPRVAKLYATIVTPQGAPLVAGTKQLTDKLANRINEVYGQSIIVNYAMRYSQPSMASVLETMRQQHIQRLLILPLYPQYAASTVASVFDQTSKILQQWRWIPELHFITSYHDYRPYIQALAKHIRQKYHADQLLIFSFHGLPLSMLQAGDPYYCHCHKTARLLAAELALEPHQWRMTFQSRFGRQPWLQPYTDKTLAQLPKDGVTKVQITCPGFSIDCLETLEEIAEENREIFMTAGGESYQYIACLNHSQSQVDVLYSLLARHLEHWRTIDNQRDEVDTSAIQQQLYESASTSVNTVNTQTCMSCKT